MKSVRLRRRRLLSGLSAGDSWRDPTRISQYVIGCLVYFGCLLAVHHNTDMFSHTKSWLRLSVWGFEISSSHFDGPSPAEYNEQQISHVRLKREAIEADEVSDLISESTSTERLSDPFNSLQLNHVDELYYTSRIAERRSADGNDELAENLIGADDELFQNKTSWVDMAVEGVGGANATESKADDGDAEAGGDPLFPKELFTNEQLRQGFVVFHILGVIYMFVALAIVCDEFFVPALDVIIEVIGCSEDVAGATFMAAGGSAPELFTSVIGIFVAFNDVGIGTIVGSAVFNILFVIGMCALFSKTVLHLTWWPLFRDCTFYAVSLVTLIFFFLDEKIEWYEAAILLGIYFAYVLFMKFNAQAEAHANRLLFSNKVNRSADNLPGAGATGAAMSGVASYGNSASRGLPMLHSGTHFRHGLLQLMIHTIDPLHEGKVDDKANHLHAIASLKVLLDANKPNEDGSPPAGVAGANNNQSSHIPSDSNNNNNNHEPSNTISSSIGQTEADEGYRSPPVGRALHDSRRRGSIASVVNNFHPSPMGRNSLTEPGGLEMAPSGEDSKTLETEDGASATPLDLSWPGSLREQITYLLFLPIIIPLWLTLPDTRKASARKFFPITFLGSIVWIALFSYLMVWWATTTGNVLSIPPPVMGLTFLAAGTSIPDLITSVIVARKGFGDMAVSSSVGSNIFDVTVGLPFPWLLYTAIFQKSVKVSATNIVCSIAILFAMLMLVFFSILLFKWRMTRGMGFSMFILYFLFVFVSLGFEYKYYECKL